MCLGIPMEVVEIDQFEARCVARGVERTVSLFLLHDQEVKPGDHVMVHLGQALQLMTPDEARESWALLDQLLALQEEPAEAERTPAMILEKPPSALVLVGDETGESENIASVERTQGELQAEGSAGEPHA